MSNGTEELTTEQQFENIEKHGVGGDQANISEESVLPFVADAERMSHAGLELGPLTQKYWETLRKKLMYCDRCADPQAPTDLKVISELPCDITSANAGESAQVCCFCFDEVTKKGTGRNE